MGVRTKRSAPGRVFRARNISLGLVFDPYLVSSHDEGQGGPVGLLPVYNIGGFGQGRLDRLSEIGLGVNQDIPFVLLRISLHNYSPPTQTLARLFMESARAVLTKVSDECRRITILGSSVLRRERPQENILDGAPLAC